MLCELETDKVSVEVPSPASGTLAEIYAKDERRPSPPAASSAASPAAAPAPAQAAAPVAAAGAAAADAAPRPPPCSATSRTPPRRTS